MTPDDTKSRIDELFSMASELPADKRAAFLDVECGKDPTIRQAVEDLLTAREEAHESTHPILQTSPEGHTVAYTPRHVDNAILGAELGPYKVCNLLGRGGFGEVYRAERTRDFDQTVAVKVGRDKSENLPRFRLERQLLSDLQHENIARLLDGGQLDDGRPYIVMEYVEGEPITKFCNEHSLSVRSRVLLFAQVCDAVSYAHRKGVIHRDLKPDNILVTVKDDQHTIKLLDFGIAKIADPIKYVARRMWMERTLTPAMGQKPMTPRYASPEQLSGASVTAASDVFSLGILLFELLTDLLPHSVYLEDTEDGDCFFIMTGDSAVKPSQAVLDATLVGYHPDPVFRFLGRDFDMNPYSVAGNRNCRPMELHQALAGDLDAITLKALARPPHDRYQTVDALLTDVKRYLNRPSTNRPRWILRLGSRDSGGIMLAIAFLCVVATAVAALLTVELNRTQVELSNTREEHDATAKALVQAQSDEALWEPVLTFFSHPAHRDIAQEDPKFDDKIIDAIHDGLQKVHDTRRAGRLTDTVLRNITADTFQTLLNATEEDRTRRVSASEE